MGRVRVHTDVSPCLKCASRVCLKDKKPCRTLLRLLPGPFDGLSGSNHWAQLLGPDFGRNSESWQPYEWRRRQREIERVRGILDSLALVGRIADVSERYFWLGESQEEIALAVGCSHATVSRILLRVRQLALRIPRRD